MKSLWSSRSPIVTDGEKRWKRKTSWPFLLAFAAFAVLAASCTPAWMQSYNSCTAYAEGVHLCARGNHAEVVVAKGRLAASVAPPGQGSVIDRVDVVEQQFERYVFVRGRATQVGAINVAFVRVFREQRSVPPGTRSVPFEQTDPQKLRTQSFRLEASLDSTTECETTRVVACPSTDDLARASFSIIGGRPVIRVGNTPLLARSRDGWVPGPSYFERFVYRAIERNEQFQADSALVELRRHYGENETTQRLDVFVRTAREETERVRRENDARAAAARQAEANRQTALAEQLSAQRVADDRRRQIERRIDAAPELGYLASSAEEVRFSPPGGAQRLLVLPREVYSESGLVEVFQRLEGPLVEILPSGESHVLITEFLDWPPRVQLTVSSDILVESAAFVDEEDPDNTTAIWLLRRNPNSDRLEVVERFQGDSSQAPAWAHPSAPPAFLNALVERMFIAARECTSAEHESSWREFVRDDGAWERLRGQLYNACRATIFASPFEIQSSDGARDAIRRLYRLMPFGALDPAAQRLLERAQAGLCQSWTNRFAAALSARDLSTARAIAEESDGLSRCEAFNDRQRRIDSAERFLRGAR